MPESIQERVLRVIATTKRIPLESVHPESSFEALGIDSLDRLNILFDLESEFDIEIDDEDAKQVSTIPQMVEGIALIVAAKAAGEPTPHFPRSQPAVMPPPMLPSADVPGREAGIEPGVGPGIAPNAEGGINPENVPGLPPKADE